MSFEVLTVATGETAGLKRLADSMARFGAGLSVVGRGEVWRGFGWRWKRLVQAVRESAAEVVLHVDGYDSICLGPVEDLVARFLKMVGVASSSDPVPLTPALSPGEREVLPDGQRPAIVFSSEWQGQPEPWLWLNPGMMIARRKDFLEVFDQAWLEEVFPDHFNDMFQLQLLYGNDPGLFWIDRGNELFLTQSGPQVLKEGDAAGWVHGPNGADLAGVERLSVERGERLSVGA